MRTRARHAGCRGRGDGTAVGGPAARRVVPERARGRLGGTGHGDVERDAVSRGCGRLEGDRRPVGEHHFARLPAVEGRGHVAVEAQDLGLIKARLRARTRVVAGLERRVVVERDVEHDGFGEIVNLDRGAFAAELDLQQVRDGAVALRSVDVLQSDYFHVHGGRLAVQEPSPRTPAPPRVGVAAAAPGDVEGRSGQVRHAGPRGQSKRRVPRPAVGPEGAQLQVVRDDALVLAAVGARDHAGGQRPHRAGHLPAQVGISGPQRPPRVRRDGREQARAQEAREGGRRRRRRVGVEASARSAADDVVE